MKKRILPDWNTYRRSVMHPESPPEQVSEFKNAFYAGTISMFRLITTISDKHPENKAMRILEEITREFTAHAEEVAKKAGPKPLTENTTRKGGRNDPPTTARPADPQPQPTNYVIEQRQARGFPDGTIEIEEYELAQWCAGAPDTKPEQLHLLLKLKGIEGVTLVIRFKTRQAWDTLTGIGDGHADQIWPDGGK